MLKYPDIFRLWHSNPTQISFPVLLWGRRYSTHDFSPSIILATSLWIWTSLAELWQQTVLSILIVNSSNNSKRCTIYKHWLFRRCEFPQRWSCRWLCLLFLHAQRGHILIQKMPCQITSCHCSGTKYTSPFILWLHTAKRRLKDAKGIGLGRGESDGGVCASDPT